MNTAKWEAGLLGRVPAAGLASAAGTQPQRPASSVELSTSSDFLTELVMKGDAGEELTPPRS